MNGCDVLMKNIYGRRNGAMYEDYAVVLPLLLDAIKVVGCGSNQFILVYDNVRKDAIYYSDLWRSTFHGLSLDPHVSYEKLRCEAVEGEWERCVEFNDVAQAFYDTLPYDDKLNYESMFASTVRCNGMSVRLLHKYIPLRLDQTGKIWLSLVLSFPATENCGRNIEMRNIKTQERLVYQGVKRGWEKQRPICLSSRERSILIMATQGCSLKCMADSLCISIDSVKACRRRLFDKLGVKNIQEALTYVMNSNFML